MPNYAYECEKCGNKFERLKKYEERLSAERCPNCGERARRMLGIFGGISGGFEKSSVVFDKS